RIKNIAHQAEPHSCRISGANSSVSSSDESAQSLRVLQTFIRKLPGSLGNSVHLELLEDYRQYSRDVRENYQVLELSSGSCLFPVKTAAIVSDPIAAKVPGSHVPALSAPRPPNAGPISADPQGHTATSSAALLMEVSRHLDASQAPDIRWWSAALSIPS